MTIHRSSYVIPCLHTFVQVITSHLPSSEDSAQFSSVAQSCLTLCDSMDCSMPGFPVLHMSPGACSNSCPSSRWCRPISSSSVPFSSGNLSQHQSLFQSVSSSHQVAKVFWASASASVLPLNIQDWSSLGLTGWISLQSKGLSRVFSNTTVQKHQFFGTQLFL